MLLTFVQQKKNQHICVSLDVNFNKSLTNDIVSFEQLGPGLYRTYIRWFCHSQTINRLSKPQTLFHVFSLICSGRFAKRVYQVKFTSHKHLITPHVFWVHICLNIPKFAFVNIGLWFSAIRFWYVDLRLSITHLHIHSNQNIVDYRYLEFQGTLWNTSRYPYLDILDLQNWGRNNSNNRI